MSELESAIERNKDFAKSQSYTMAIGELINLYQSDEIDLHPEYQRAYRWSQRQKVALIESILLELPLPPIFVAQTHTGKWDVVDGLQRLATIFEFIGIFKNTDGSERAPLTLLGTELLPELDGATYSGDSEKALTPALRLAFKRARMEVIILMPQSFETARTELFIRLNTGGTTLTAQEIRNVVLIMQQLAFFDWFHSLGEQVDFQQCIALPKTDLERAAGDELVLKLLTLRDMPAEELGSITDLGDFLTRKTRTLVNDTDQDIFGSVFSRTFTLLNTVAAAKSFRVSEDDPTVPDSFQPHVFDIVALGLAHNIDQWNATHADDLRARIGTAKANGLWREESLATRIETGRGHFRRG